MQFLEDFFMLFIINIDVLHVEIIAHIFFLNYSLFCGLKVISAIGIFSMFQVDFRNGTLKLSIRLNILKVVWFKINLKFKFYLHLPKP